MMKKTLLAIALSALSLTAFAASDTPDILAALSDDSAQQIALMTDEQLSETKGSGIPNQSFSQYYYAWNFYGSKNDSRSYNFAYSGSQPGGMALGNGFYRIGYIYYTTTSKLGTNAPSSSFSPIEQLTVDAFNTASGPAYYTSSLVSFKNWIR
jgi:hypothetical protein